MHDIEIFLQEWVLLYYVVSVSLSMIKQCRIIISLVVNYNKVMNKCSSQIKNKNSFKMFIINKILPVTLKECPFNAFNDVLKM